MVSKHEFIREYSKAIIDKQASVFIGAGMSRSCGFVDWKELLRPLAKDINLDVDKETDFISLAQYYKNERNRGQVNQKIMDAFTSNVEINENLSILARLPLSTYWTTNYDNLIECALRSYNRNPDVKCRKSQLSTVLKDRDAIVYKMHGDISDPSEAVLTKEDYERYEQTRSLFRTALKGELVSKTFLFTGFSFEDPNLEFILGRVCYEMNNNIRTHYCFFKNIDSLEDDYEYKKCKQELRIKDLSQRYGVQTVLLNSWDEITELLKEIEKKIKLKRVFISGSAQEYNTVWTKDKIEELASAISQKLISNNYRITTGFGLGIGSAVINGALSTIYSEKHRNTDEYLCLKPFPQNIINLEERKRLFSEYRKDMLSEVGVAIFISGNKEVEGKVIDAPGCMEEYRIAKENGCIIIPIASTGYAAKEILNDIRQSINDQDYDYSEEEINILENSTDVNELSNSILRILEKQNI